MFLKYYNANADIEPTIVNDDITGIVDITELTTETQLSSKTYLKVIFISENAVNVFHNGIIPLSNRIINDCFSEISLHILLPIRYSL